ncbi:hypothetical protein ACOS17_05380, partial [Serratia sp. CY43514]
EDGVAIGNFEGQPLFHASLAHEEYTRLLQENGFRVVDHVMWKRTGVINGIPTARGKRFFIPSLTSISLWVNILSSPLRGSFQNILTFSM